MTERERFIKHMFLSPLQDEDRSVHKLGSLNEDNVRSVMQKEFNGVGYNLDAMWECGLLCNKTNTYLATSLDGWLRMSKKPPTKKDHGYYSNVNEDIKDGSNSGMDDDCSNSNMDDDSSGSSDKDDFLTIDKYKVLLASIADKCYEGMPPDGWARLTSALSRQYLDDKEDPSYDDKDKMHTYTLQVVRYKFRPDWHKQPPVEPTVARKVVPTVEKQCESDDSLDSVNNLFNSESSSESDAEYPQFNCGLEIKTPSSRKLVRRTISCLKELHGTFSTCTFGDDKFKQLVYKAGYRTQVLHHATVANLGYIFSLLLLARQAFIMLLLFIFPVKNVARFLVY